MADQNHNNSAPPASPAPAAAPPPPSASSPAVQLQPESSGKAPAAEDPPANHVQYQILVPWRHVAGPAELEQIAGQLKRGASSKNPNEDENTSNGPVSPNRGRPTPPSVASPRIAAAHSSDGTAPSPADTPTATSPIRERATSPGLVRGESKENIRGTPSSGEGSPRRGNNKEKDQKAKDSVERSISLKNMANSVKSFFKPEDRDKIVIDRPEHPEEDNKKPFPGVRLHVIATTPPELQPAFPGLPMHLSSDLAKKIESGDKPPKPAFPGLPLHVVDELGQRKTYVGKDLREWTVSSSPRRIPPELARGRSGSPRHLDLVGKACVVVPRSGKVALQGLRPNMEDFYSAFDDLKEQMPALPWEARFAFYGVYDGHAGPQCAEILKELLYRNILEHQAFAKGAVPEALHHGFLRTDSQILEVASREQWRTGSTAVVAVIVNNVLWVANVGDSELVLARRRPRSSQGKGDQRDSTPSKARDAIPPQSSNNSTTSVTSSSAPPGPLPAPGTPSPPSTSSAPISVVPMLPVDNASGTPSRDPASVTSPLRARDSAGEEPIVDAQVLTSKHKPTIPEEKARIEAAGGKVVFGRLFAELAVSRAFGDRDFKKPISDSDFLSVEPHLIEVRLQPGVDEFFILASDGLWDKVTYQQAAELVRDQKMRGRSPDEIATFLANTALQLRSKDNVTVLVVFLEWRLEDQDRKDREARFGAVGSATATSTPAVAGTSSSSSNDKEKADDKKEKEPAVVATSSNSNLSGGSSSNDKPNPVATAANPTSSPTITTAISATTASNNNSANNTLNPNTSLTLAPFDLNALVTSLKVKYKDLTISSDDAVPDEDAATCAAGVEAAKAANPKMLARSPDPRKGGAGLGGGPPAGKRALLKKTEGKEGHGVAYTAATASGLTSSNGPSPPGTLDQVPTGFIVTESEPKSASNNTNSAPAPPSPAPASIASVSSPVVSVPTLSTSSGSVPTAATPAITSTPVAESAAAALSSSLSGSTGENAASSPPLRASTLETSPFAAPAAATSSTPVLSSSLAPPSLSGATPLGSAVSRPMSTTVDWHVSVQKTLQSIQEEEKLTAGSTSETTAVGSASAAPAASSSSGSS